MTSHVTVDARMLGSSGIGTYLEELLPRVLAGWPDARFTLLGDVPAIGAVVPAGRAELRDCGAPIYSVGEQLALSRLIPGDTTLVWSPHYNIPLLHRGPLAVTVHDVNHLVFPQPSLAKRMYARLMFAEVRRRAAVVLCDSEFGAADLRARVGEPRALSVVPLGVGESWFRLPEEPSPLDAPYLLYVGNVKPHKNLARLIEAFAGIVDQCPHRLVIVGRREGLRTADGASEAQASALGDRVVFTGHVGRPALERYIAACDAMVIPSLYEGFGLPALEALACGRAVGVSRAASLPEVCGPMADYFDPLDVHSIAASLRRLALRAPDTPAEREARRAWARRFDWDASASATVAALKRAEGAA